MPPRTRKPPTDLTGRQAEDNAEAARADAKAREEALAMATALPPEPDEDEGIIDATGRVPVLEEDTPPAAPVEPEVVDEDGTVYDYTDPKGPKVADSGRPPAGPIDGHDGGKTAQERLASQTVAEMEEALAGRDIVATGVTTVEAADDTVVIQVIDTVKDMTFGLDEHGNAATRTFIAGKRYRVKRALAEHLREKGYIY